MLKVETNSEGQIVAVDPGNQVYNEGEDWVDWDGDASHDFSRAMG